MMKYIGCGKELQASASAYSEGKRNDYIYISNNMLLASTVTFSGIFPFFFVLFFFLSFTPCLFGIIVTSKFIIIIIIIIITTVRVVAVPFPPYRGVVHSFSPLLPFFPFLPFNLLFYLFFPVDLCIFHFSFIRLPLYTLLPPRALVVIFFFFLSLIGSIIFPSRFFALHATVLLSFFFNTTFCSLCVLPEPMFHFSYGCYFFFLLPCGIPTFSFDFHFSILPLFRISV
uniref:WGS project CAEQ00000000 data, annotated contig 2219 n=1 Tax=Trypanosoma congolense (strain IL3000) TaxID=1068625 RepID=F9WCE6_TRYCI|nr:unnamed protein product [Trypanosoma congolense IL3000]